MDAATRRPRSGTRSGAADEQARAEPISVAHGSILFFASSVVGAAGFFVASLLLARLLGPSGRGTVAFVTVTALLTARVVKLGSWSGDDRPGRPGGRRRGPHSSRTCSRSRSPHPSPGSPSSSAACISSTSSRPDSSPSHLAILAAAIVAAFARRRQLPHRVREAARGGRDLGERRLALCGGRRGWRSRSAASASRRPWSPGSPLTSSGQRFWRRRPAHRRGEPAERSPLRRLDALRRARVGRERLAVPERTRRPAPRRRDRHRRDAGPVRRRGQRRRDPALPPERHRDVAPAGTRARSNPGRDRPHASDVQVGVGAHAREHRRHGSARVVPDPGALRCRVPGFGRTLPVAPARRARLRGAQHLHRRAARGAGAGPVVDEPRRRARRGPRAGSRPDPGVRRDRRGGRGECRVPGRRRHGGRAVPAGEPVSRGARSCRPVATSSSSGSSRRARCRASRASA